ncbi:MAG: HNH endonuclease, partial [Lachnospiraceae bacterium]|nr:HNH endonuclease [Lachnospiraceae bacterium]
MDKIQRKSFNQEERQKILDKTCCSCGHCGKKLDVTEMTVDHIFPLYKGGTHDEYNLIALCKECNNEKSNF